MGSCMRRRDLWRDHPKSNRMKAVGWPSCAIAQRSDVSELRHRTFMCDEMTCTMLQSVVQEEPRFELSHA